MKKILSLAIFAGSFLLTGIDAAQATCISPFEEGGIALPRNDVSIDLGAFDVASVPLTAYEVDMNGVQPGFQDGRLWSTHGTLVVLIPPTGEIEFIASWTQNTSVDSVEWVCRFEFEPGAPVLLGSGTAHSFTFGTSAAIPQCNLEIALDC